MASMAASLPPFGFPRRAYVAVGGGNLPVNRYVLPDLPYDYGALEPHVSAEIMKLHHDKHHRAYVEKANAALEKLLEAQKRDNFDQIATLERQLAFNVS